MLFVDVAQLDLRDEFRLCLINAEPDHQIGYDLCVLLSITDNGDGTVNVQQDLFQAFQQVKLCFFLLHVAVDPAADTLCAPGGPLV